MRGKTAVKMRLQQRAVEIEDDGFVQNDGFSFYINLDSSVVIIAHKPRWLKFRP